ncbi:MAG: sigma 54-interacting transcriptional regulator [Gemmatimonadota bacterium]
MQSAGAGESKERATVAVLALTESFGSAWAEVADAADAALRLESEAGELAPLGEVDALIVGAAGREFDLDADIDSLRSAGAGPIAVVGADTGHRAAVAALGTGAREYFALPGDLAALRAWVSALCDEGRSRARAAQRAETEQRAYDFSAIIGDSELLRDAVRRAGKVIPRDRATVLLTGETGTGKELIAQAIHYNGPRAASPFVEVNCSALPANLLEAELFGYERGAFTDARTAKPGLFEAAHGGTLFLDEIGELRIDLQAKLLRALEERSVRRLGSLRSRPVDVRIIAATHVDLPAAVEAGDFRQDLYYRLNVVSIHLPPLRERGQDVLLLARHFLDDIAGDYDLERPDLPAALEQTLLLRPWPGNVRELRNAMERAVVLGGEVLSEEDLFPPLAAEPAEGPIPFPATIDEIELAAAHAMLTHHRGNKSAAARALGVSRSRLYRLLGEES